MRRRIEFYMASIEYGRRFAMMVRSANNSIDGRVGVAQPVVFVDGDPEECTYEPTMKLTSDECQQLMDELWKCGLRPTEGSGSAGSLAATERHLKDMQSVAFGLLKGQGVEL